MNKLTFKLMILLIFVLSLESYAQRNRTKSGVGIILGHPDVGISIKFLNNGYRYFNGAVAWSSGSDNKNNDGYLYLHGDYIFKQWRIFDRSATNFATYIGAGLQLVTGDPTAFGVRIPLGLNYTFNEVPIDAFIELVPQIELVPDTDFNVDAAFAIRFLF